MNNTINSLMYIPTVSNILPHMPFFFFLWVCLSRSACCVSLLWSVGRSLSLFLSVSLGLFLTTICWAQSHFLSFPSLLLCFSFLNPLKATPLWHFTLKRLNMYLLKKDILAVFITYLSPFLPIPEKINKLSILCIVPTQITFIVPQIYFTCMLFLDMCAN